METDGFAGNEKSVIGELAALVNLNTITSSFPGTSRNLITRKYAPIK